VHGAYLGHKVIVLRDQAIDLDAFRVFGRIFGEPDRHTLSAVRHPDVDDVIVLSNQDEPGRKPEAKYVGSGWHTDHSYKQVPANATMLLATEVPDEDGDTLFADLVAAFAALPKVTQDRLRGMRLRHQYRYVKDRTDPWGRWVFMSEAERQATPEVVHPAVRRHPETGAEALFVASRRVGSIIGVEGMAKAASDVFLDELVAHITSTPFVYRHKYRPNDLIVWDNRCTLHCATTDVLDSRKVRRLLRITTKGSVPVAA